MGELPQAPAPRITLSGGDARFDMMCERKERKDAGSLGSRYSARVASLVGSVLLAFWLRVVRHGRSSILRARREVPAGALGSSGVQH